MKTNLTNTDNSIGILQVIAKECKHTAIYGVNYLAYCDQLILTQFISYGHKN